MPLYRIRRMGNQFESCGIGVRPPEDRIGQPAMKRLCPKLVPGQVIELPEGHTLATQRCIERVRRVEEDEILRPWVFKSAEDAAMANPAKSRLSADAITNGLAMVESAQEKRQELADIAERKRAEAAELKRAGIERGYAPEQDDDEPEVDRRSQNRLTRDVYEDAEPVEDDEPEAQEPEEEQPVRRSRSRRRS